MGGLSSGARGWGCGHEAWDPGGVVVGKESTAVYGRRWAGSPGVVGRRWAGSPGRGTNHGAWCRGGGQGARGVVWGRWVGGPGRGVEAAGRGPGAWCRGG